MAQINDTRYDKLRKQIEDWLEEGREQEEIMNLKHYPDTTDKDMLLTILGSTFGLDSDMLNLEKYQLIVKEVYERKKGHRTIKLSDGAKNAHKVPTNPFSQWQKYREKLEKSNFDSNAIQNIQSSSLSLLRELSDDTKNSEPIKGLVIGAVQSGKTANMIGLVSMAADVGFNYFIILTGTIGSLRQQTEDRFVEDLSTLDSMLHWEFVTNPDIKNRSQSQNISRFDFQTESKKRYISISLKNSTRLKNLVDWIYSDANQRENIKLLIIDDEADQAGVNTNHKPGERTRINQLIIDLVHGFDKKNARLKAVNYVMYTATPYANLLNEAKIVWLFVNKD